MTTLLALLLAQNPGRWAEAVAGIRGAACARCSGLGARILPR